MGKVYGYCRISTAKQNIERQKINIIRKYPSAQLVEETFTGINISRNSFYKYKRELRESTEEELRKQGLII